jgi:tetratricopeptide (TPR) repeat protein
VKRAHDLNQRWTYILREFIPVAGLYWTFVLFFKKGDEDDNAFGKNPVTELAPPADNIVFITCVLVVVIMSGWAFAEQAGRHETDSAGKTATTTAPEKMRHHSPEINQLIAETQGNCNRPKFHKLVKALWKADDPKGAISHAERYWKSCGQFLQLRWITFEAHKDLSEWDKAIEDVTKLINDDPYDKDFWVWRALVYERIGEYKKAAADYEKALALVPALKQIPANLAEMYDKLGSPCRGLEALKQYRKHHPDIGNAGWYKARIDDLKKKGNGCRKNFARDNQ